MNNDNVILFKKIKKIEEENDIIKKENERIKIILNELKNENSQKNEIIKNFEIKQDNEKNFNLNVKEDLFKTKEENNNLKKEIEDLKAKCINSEKLERKNELLILDQKKKEVEIKDLNNLIKKLKEGILEENNQINEEPPDSEATKQIKEKERIIKELKEEKDNIQEQLNKKRAIITQLEAMVKNKDLLLKQYYKKKKKRNNQ